MDSHCRNVMQQWSVSALCQGRTPSRSSATVELYGNHILMFGGRNGAGAATDTLYMLDLTSLASDGGWVLAKCSEDAPCARWGHTSFVYQQCLWVYGGFDGQNQLDDLYRLDLSSLTWTKVQQGGTLPDRRLGKHRTFHTAAASPAGHSMLAFGVAPQDAENTDPIRPPTSPSLRLHIFDLDQHIWSVVHTAGSISIQKLEALQCHAHKLIAIGWSTLATTNKADSNMQVCWLDLSSITSCRTPSFKLGSTRSKPTPSWQQLQPQGMVPSARTSVATSVLGNQLLLHGGMLCSKSVAGRLAADTFCLNLSTWTWTRLAAAQEKAVGSSSINTARAGHRAVAVPSAAAVMLIGGTSSRQAFASCDTIECLRQIGTANMGQPTHSATSSEGTTAAGVAPGGAGPGMEAVLSATPTLLGIQPFGHVTSTPNFVTQPTPHREAATVTGSGQPAVTPAVKLSSTSRVTAEAAAAAAAPSSALLPALDFSQFCFSETLTDVELVAGGRSFPAHRLLLCAQSPALAHMIQSQVVAANQPGTECRWTLTLPDIYPDILALMLQYMYCSLKAIPVDAAPLLFKAADRYGLVGLRAAALKVVVATIDLDNICNNVLLAHDHKCSELSQACILFVAASPEHFQQVLATPGYLDLNESHPRVGTAFVQAVTQLLLAKRG